MHMELNHIRPNFEIHIKCEIRKTDNMRELKCPHCGSVFTVDEADYASIVSQVKNAEFDAEIGRRMEELEARREAEQELTEARTRKEFAEQMNGKEKELIAKENEIERLKSQMETLSVQLNGERQLEVDRLKEQLKNIEAQKDAERDLALAEKEKTITALQSTVNQADTRLKMAVMEEQKRAEQELQARDHTISQLQSDMKMERFKAEAETAKLKEQHKLELEAKQEQIDYYRDFKMRMSTKMIGESLETHCSTLFNQMLRPILPNAYFEKDNDVTEGTKGDFIFRDMEDGVEYVSVMFEMKNEMDTTATKHKNEDFLKKLDEDRRKKGCEFAVLVSLLEPDNELYNGGIVDGSHRYEKMYVIRPQFFIPIITLLRNAALNSLKYQRELQVVKNQQIDILHFEENMNTFKEGFARNFELASRRFHEAIEDIDKTIKALEKTKADLLSSDRNLRLANDKAQDLSIKKLTRGAPSVKEMFDELSKKPQS